MSDGCLSPSTPRLFLRGGGGVGHIRRRSVRWDVEGVPVVWVWSSNGKGARDVGCTGVHPFGGVVAIPPGGSPLYPPQPLVCQRWFIPAGWLWRVLWGWLGVRVCSGCGGCGGGLLGWWC